MIFSEKWGKDIDEAVELALRDLAVDKDQVEIIVLEEPSRGFLGLGSKLAKVRVEIKENSKNEQKASKDTEAKKPEKVERKEEKREKPRVHKKEYSKEPSKSNMVFSDFGELEEIKDHEAINFLRETTEKMGLELEFLAKESKDNLYIEIQGKEAGAVIGKRGQTLDSIQYLTSLVVNREQEKYKRVILNAESYREKREKTLEQLANRLAHKVKKTRRSIRLEPMNPYERKVIHATLQKNPDVLTKSEGEEPYRRVIIKLK